MIWLRDPAGPLAPRVLTSRRPVTFIGDVSYSLYLWHWPLIFIAPFALGETVGSIGKVALIGVAVLLATATKRYVEDPPRRARRGVLQRPRTVLLAALVSVALLLAGSTAASAAVDARANAAAQRLYAATLHPGECVGAQAALSGASCAESHRVARAEDALVDVAHQIDGVPGGDDCKQDQGEATIESCRFGADAPEKRVALIGDSHAQVWISALAAIAETNRLGVTTYLQSGCPVALDDTLKYGPQRSPAIDAGCRTWRRAVIDAVAADPDIDVVVTSSKQFSYVDAATGRVDDGAGYARAWKQWLAAGKQVVVIGDVPDRVVDVPACVSREVHEVDPCTAPASQFPRVGPLSAAVADVHDDRLTYVDWYDVFCDTVCHSVIGGIPAYVDPSHLTSAFARSFAPQLARLEALR